jgi:hypothetical protein
MISCARLIRAGFFMCSIGITACFAHSVELFVEDNGDGTILVKAGESDGEPASGAAVVIRDKETTQPILTFAMPDSGKIKVPMPKVPYTVTVDMGSGHTVTRTGPFTDRSVTRSKPAQPRATLKNQAVPIGTAAVLIFVTIALLSVSAKLRKKNDDFLKRRPRS